LRRLLLALQDGIQLLHAHRVHGGEDLPAAVRVPLLRDQVLQIAVGHRLVLPRQGDGRRGLDVRVLVAEARGGEPDDSRRPACAGRSEGERVVGRQPGLLLSGSHRVEGRLLEEAVVSDVGELLQRGPPCVPAYQPSTAWMRRIASSSLAQVAPAPERHLNEQAALHPRSRYGEDPAYVQALREELEAMRRIQAVLGWYAGTQGETLAAEAHLRRTRPPLPEGGPRRDGCR